ncbi:MAG: hypothetical protein WBX15_09965 [Thermoanaerobaculia bacterium]
MTSVLVTGIGGSIGIDVARSLRRDASVRIIGGDGNEWGRRIAAGLCDEVVALPRADHDASGFVSEIERVIAERSIDFVFINPDPELEGVAATSYRPSTSHALPPPPVIEVCLDKSKTVSAAKGSSAFPRTIPIADDQDVVKGFEQLGSPLWLRARVGPGGRGSISVASADEALSWIRYWQSRGRADRWMMQEYLPGRNFNWTGVYADGKLMISVAMERLRYFLAEPAVSGISGQVAFCATVQPERFLQMATDVVLMVDPNPSGFYSVDIREDAAGEPKVTEINPRLAGRPWLYTNAGVNLPLFVVRRALRMEPGDAVSPKGLAVGLHEYRQLDVEPVFGVPSQ